MREIAKRPRAWVADRVHGARCARIDGPRVSPEGYGIFAPGSLPHSDALLAVGIKRPRDRTGDLAGRAALAAWPEMMAFATSPQMVSMAAAYLGTMPLLYNLQYWRGDASTPHGSPHFHLDTLDTRCLRVYLYVTDVGPEHGPLTFLPQPDSRRFVRATGYLGDGVPDDLVFQHADRRRVVSATGPAGTIIAADTTRCLHYGSRITSGERVVFIVTFATAHHWEKHRSLLPQAV